MVKQMSTAQDIDELDDNSAPKTLPTKSSRYAPGFASLDKSGKRNIIIFALVAIGAIWFIFSGASPNEKVKATDETTGDMFSAAKIDVAAAGTNTEENDPEVLQNIRAAQSESANFAVDNDMSGIQDLTYGNWMNVSEVDTPTSTLGSPLANRVSEDRARNTGSNRDLKKMAEQLRASTMKSSFFTSTTVPTDNRTNQSAEGNLARNSRINQNEINNNTQLVKDNDTLEKGGSLLPGDVLTCLLLKALNTDVSIQTSCIVQGSALDGALITLQVKREEDYMYLTGTHLVFERQHTQLAGAIAVDTGDVAANGIRDGVDYHTLSRWSALMVAGAGQAITTLVGQPKTSQTISGNATIIENVAASKREIIVAALAKPADIASDRLMEHFKTPPTVTLEKNKIIHIFITQPVTAPWMPDMSIEKIQRVKIRGY